MTGKANPAIKYGIYISRVGNGTGVTVDNYSTDFEMENVEVANIPIAGIYIKTDPFYANDCSYAHRDNFTMKNISVHDCYIHDVEDEGMYIGSSKYTGTTITGTVSGYNDHCGSTSVLPHIIEGVRVYDNIVEDTGWDGIQVSSTTKDCFIYNNVIRNDSYKETQFQMSGILIGGGSNCDCYNNKIYDGKGDGIDILGLGNAKIYNNLIVRAGASYHPSDPPTTWQKHGIWIGHVSTTAGSQTLIYNNTIVGPRSFGMKLTNPNISSYKVYNNIIVDPGLFETLGENAYINISAGVNFESSNNQVASTISSVGFVNSNSDNYDLIGTSPAVNTGMNLLGFGLSFDIDDRVRPFAGFYDIGAYESQDPTIGIEDRGENQSKIIIESISPNPITYESILRIQLEEPSYLRISILDPLGKLMEVIVDESKDNGNHSFTISKSGFEPGLYFLVVESQFGKVSKKLIII